MLDSSPARERGSMRARRSLRRGRAPVDRCTAARHDPGLGSAPRRPNGPGRGPARTPRRPGPCRPACRGTCGMNSVRIRVSSSGSPAERASSSACSSVSTAWLSIPMWSRIRPRSSSTAATRSCEAAAAPMERAMPRAASQCFDARSQGIDASRCLRRDERGSGRPARRRRRQRNDAPVRRAGRRPRLTPWPPRPRRRGGADMHGGQMSRPA